MNYLIKDKCLHVGTSGVIMAILQFMNKYIKTNKLNYSDVKNIFIEKKVACNFDDIFDDNYDNNNIKILVYDDDNNKESVNYNNVHNNNEYKILAKKIRFSKKINNIINNELINITDNTLGVHFRFTDMNAVHTRKNPIQYKNYLSKILEHIKNHNIQSIFVASDNEESINKLLKDDNFKNIKIYHTNIRRYPTEKADEKDLKWYKNDNKKFPHPYLNNFRHTSLDGISTSKLHLECLVDCILLSKCKYLIFPYSNVSNLSILLSNSIIKKTKISGNGY
tara:strand:- start:746 stop:1582 length:837 start_codon:yes stop_codon:yes gene_type:complete